jgi:predicted RNA-binding Zn-ribbon protein involved in translation (DUF1610 family)
MAQEDYPYCIFCPNKVTHLVLQDNAVVYLCSHCGESATVEDNG